MNALLQKLGDDYPQLQFVAGSSFYWSPETGEVFYDTSRSSDETGRWSLLHETSHALLGHTSYKTDIELLHLEVAAWEHAGRIAGEYDIRIEDDYIQDCLDTYRDWLYRRSLCPDCGTQCLQTDESSHYRCFNCRARWHVSPSRFCRAYRRAEQKQSAPVFALQHLR